MAGSRPQGPVGQYEDLEKNRAEARRAVVYSRIATEALEPSLDDQERTGCRWARQNAWEIVECIHDTAGGSSTDDPGLQRLGQLLAERRVDVVVAHSPDNFAQCQDQLQQLLAQLEQAGASLEFVIDGKPQV